MDNIQMLLTWLGLIIYFIASPFDCLIICSLVWALNFLDSTIFSTNEQKNSTTADSKIIQIVVIDCGKLNIDEMVVYPTVEQYELKGPCLKPTIMLGDQSQGSLLTSHGEIPEITIELRKPTVDQLLCYPTVDQYHLEDTILKPTVYYRAYHSLRKSSPSSKVSPAMVVQFGKPLLKNI
ncbi:hypothetical protein CDAR_61721 [Caerostris darwini]|uniref:Uncharacterized protein n=1 Tax=Caerostris darwini TaxID=1538125 RepID=A0AAV4VJ54_9ARAC|nr:hypothetical protein CDAR_61721 [Caerostris darwini]